jgi:hypothetical protein
MKLYCMCQITGDVPKAGIGSQGFGPIDNQVFMAPNRFGVMKENDDFRPVILARPMVCIKNGVAQMVGDGPRGIPNSWPKTKEEMEKDCENLKFVRRHYPNVDLYECPVCRSKVCVE